MCLGRFCIKASEVQLLWSKAGNCGSYSRRGDFGLKVKVTCGLAKKSRLREYVACRNGLHLLTYLFCLDRLVERC